MLHLGLLFPQPHPWAHMRFAGYLLSLAIAVPYQLMLYAPVEYSRILRTDMLYLGCVGIFFCSRLVLAYWRNDSQLARQRVRVITVGTLLGFALPALVLPLAAVMAGGVAKNTAAFTPFVFALALAYAIVKHDLFEIDAMVKRGAYYLVLTGAIGTAYVLAVVSFNLVLRAGAFTDSLAFPVVFTLAVLLFFNPLRTRLQALVDRVFFGTRYDSAQMLARVGAELAGALRHEHVAQLVRDCVQEAMPNTRTRLFSTGAEGGPLEEVEDTGTMPEVLTAELAAGRLLTAFDPPEAYADPRSFEVVRAALLDLGMVVAVPVRAGERLVGALTAGPKLSGLFYTAGDAEFLRALAHETAISLQNAASYQALVELNERLEERVQERTSQLEAANGELTNAYGQLESAYDELKNAEAQLVQSEKMASLGRLVAGVAHEINNPVAFIANSVPPLRRRLAKASAVAPSEVAPLLREAEDLVGIMARGAERAAAIVRDLRTFSRLGESTRSVVDLHEGLEMSIRLLEHRWPDRVTIHRDFGMLPPVECDPGQLNQVFVNLLSNACDAVGDGGNIWIETRSDDESIAVVIRDDGVGISPEVQSHIFDPFFTTKDVGSGTGLGLAISHGIVAAHGGRIEVDSTPGAGATFTIVLPASAPAQSLDRAARSGG
jgi:signal transduction histidine kinase